MATRRTRLASAGDGCETGQFIIRLVRPHASCKIDPDHLLTVLVNGNDLRHVLGYWNMSSIYSEIGSHAPFVQPVTKTQLDNMLMTTRMLTDGMPTFPELPSPFDLFRVTKSMGLQRSAEFLYHSRGAQNWAHHSVHYVILAFWLWDRSPDGRRSTGLLADPILLVKNGITGSYRTKPDQRIIPQPASALNHGGISHVGPT